MSQSQSSHAGRRYAVLADRQTGDLWTVATDDALAKVASGQWMLVVRETEYSQENSDRFAVDTVVRIVCPTTLVPFRIAVTLDRSDFEEGTVMPEEVRV